MNILVIGNGFDLAHGLPTKYGDFLDFIAILGFESIQKNYTEITEYKKKMHLSTDEYNTKNMENDIKKLNNKDEIKVKINEILGFEEKKVSKDNNRSNTISYKNYWIEHFFKRRNEIGENWIDFEQEIGDVLKKLEYNNNFYYNIFYEIKTFYNIVYCDSELSNIKKISKKIFGENNMGIVYVYNQPIKDDRGNTQNYPFIWDDIYNKTIGDMVKNLEKDLDNLISAFEIYLKEIIEKTKLFSNNIDIQKIDKIDKVLSFNYTHTFKNLSYANDTKISYIHGETRENFNIGNNNMVLGIDEYLPDDLKDIDVKFIYFKKYFQRILKQTGAEYKEWLNIKFSRNQIKVYFFGHSLDASDKDILKEIITNENTEIKIFYIDDIQKAQQISNLVKIIGQDKLIDYTYNKKKFGTDAKIQFIKQKYKLYMNALEKKLQESYYNVMEKLDYIDKGSFIDYHLQDCMRLLYIIIDNFFLEEQKNDKEEFKKRIEEIRNTKNIEKLNELIKDFEEKLKQKLKQKV